ncbi:MULTISPECIES: DUF1998 domain-containing protein [unclassified Sphingobium]|uniref:DUF1998 domain-containing protein n=1 Tax=unclassified Sphingobium TaxID=2611147 RepID=UPI000D16D4B9|nr:MULTISPECIES: DUF1998 domain-containing protein [unclassified Sphingobium]MBG6120158.1 hypothetical protein [Sphingobium sp. JAI105]PSO12808.1 hypothetical protein C7E20_03330 [Sphingobium sp. AEW4]TWD05641.1 uncharacterized protein DUF1998 [Sphingobium sp. AEW010]TWD23194.1 uncharacterized protein DUF1998 [Sphingobium sp. AEW013]TWD25054.1 uncharacterized protein DUF1998 [Sphingobium sp. AEW001]
MTETSHPDRRAIEKFTSDQIWSAIQVHRNGGGDVEQRDLKEPEWQILTAPEPPTDYPHFLSKKVEVPKGFEAVVTRVLLLERLREVNALLGFTRVESPDEGSGDEAAPRAPLGRSVPDWIPATQVHGEGIFIQFDVDALKEWAERDAVKEVDARMHTGHRGWRQKRNLDPAQGHPGPRYAFLHTLAHMLIRELALECGYNAASIRERIYGDVEDGKDQAGFLIYTAAADSDGTLGGLVELGKPENLGRLLRQALDRGHVCASDPLCSEHDPSKDQSLHGAACHACSFVSETSCEKGNRNLDRALVVPTLENAEAAFFQAK